ncbi:DUF6630 family protein [Vibrio aerogenes]|nr:hypothetical protein [Vibrio aerogenes]
MNTKRIALPYLHSQSGLSQFVQLVDKNSDHRPLIQLIDDYQQMDAMTFYRHYNQKLQLDDCFDESEYAEEIEDGEDYLALMMIFFLQEDNQLLQLDWKGEEEEYQTVHFINRILRDYFHQNDAVNAQSVEQAMQPDDDILVLLKIVDRKLKARGYRLVNFDTGSDQYYIGVFPEPTARKLEQQKVNQLEITIVSRFED